jgi:ketosteroid isomerase-like protein
LSGTKPFEGRPLAKLLMAITQAPHVPLQQRAPALPKAVCDLVDRMLAKPRDQRPATAGLVRDELRAILGRESVMKPNVVAVAEEFEETLVILPGTRPGSTAASAPAKTMPQPAAAVKGEPATTPEEKTAIVAPPPAPPKPVAVPPVAVTAAVVPPVPAAATNPARDGSLDAKPPAAARPAPAAAPPAARPAAGAAPKRTGLVIALVLVVALLGLGGGAMAAWWFVGPRLLQMAGLSKPVPAASTPAPASAPGGEAGTGAGTPESASPASAEPVSPPGTSAADGPAAPASPTSSADRAVATPDLAPSEPAAPAVAAPAPAATSTRQSVAQSPGAPALSPSASGQVPAATNAEVRSARRTSPESAGTPAASSREARPAGGGQPPAPAAAAPRVTEQLTHDTVATLSGQRGRSPYGNTESGATVAAVNRINWVLQQYAGALQRRDAEALREYRPSPGAAETQLLGARSVALRLETLDVQVDGTSATARCRRTLDATLESGAPLRQQGNVTVSLTRRATGWVITDVR